MDEADVRLQIQHAMQRHGYWPKHNQDGRKYKVMCPHCHGFFTHTVTPEVEGLPDIEGRHPTNRFAFIEVKTIPADKKSFYFKKIEDAQRDYLANWVADGGLAFIGIGKIVPLGRTKTKIAGISVFPWEYWLGVEQHFQESIAYDWSLYKTKPKDWASKWDIVSLDPIYHMLKDKDGFYFNPLHPLASPAIVPTPFFLRGEKERRTHAVLQPFPLPGSPEPGYRSSLV